MSTIAELQRKEVIDICDGTRLGYVCDVEFDTDKGIITALRVPGRAGMFPIFGKNEDIVIPWACIKKIGDDIILTDSFSVGR